MTLAPEAIEYLRNYVFEGNVRELQGMVERAVVICEGKVIQVDDLAMRSRPEKSRLVNENPTSLFEGKTLRDMEESYIDHVFRKTNGSINGTKCHTGDRSLDLVAENQESARSDKCLIRVWRVISNGS